MGRRGDAVVETREGVVFAALGVPGDRVRLEQVSRKGKVRRGRIAAVLEASPERVEPACALAERCGGCAWMAWALEAQREAKRGALEAALREAGAERAVELVAGEALGYRRRARLAWSARGGRRLGYRERRGRRGVEVASCPVLVEALDAGWRALRAALGPALAGEGEIRLGLRDGAAVAALETEAAQGPALYQACERLVGEGAFAGVAVRVGEAPAASWGAPEERALGADGEPLEGTVGGFAQAHAGLNDALARHVAAEAAPEGKRVLELYAGHGNLSVLLARGAAAFRAVEQDGPATEALRANLAARGLAARVHAGDAAEARLEDAEVVVLDPPRSGAREVARRLAEPNGVERVVYVSCDPATLGRDLATLTAGGWTVERAVAFDMFPQTPHVETVVTLERRPAGRR